MKISATLILAISILIQGCETKKVWNGAFQKEYLQIIRSEQGEDVEAVLEKSGKQHYCDTVNINGVAKKTCYVPVPAGFYENTKDIGVKLLNTPEAIATDTGKTVMVVGYITLALFCKPSDPVKKVNSETDTEIKQSSN